MDSQVFNITILCLAHFFAMFVINFVEVYSRLRKKIGSLFTRFAHIAGEIEDYDDYGDSLDYGADYGGTTVGE